VRYSDLQPGDVVIKNEKPLFVVLACSRKDNFFKWMSLQKANVGMVYTPDFDRISFWDFLVGQGSTRILRGDTYIVCDSLQ
jgi:hypothetical protein